MRVKLLFKPKDIVIEPKELEAPVPCGPMNDMVGSGLCKFIYGDVKKKAWMCCGAPITHGNKSWCDFHRTVVFDKAKKVV